MTDMTPEVRVLEDGSLGYFYRPQQLEAINMEIFLSNCVKISHKDRELPKELQVLKQLEG